MQQFRERSPSPGFMTSTTFPLFPDSAIDVFDGLPALAWRRIDDLGLIQARGPEARQFLQSQLSNDAQLVTAEQAQLSGYCSPKGRLLAVFTLGPLEAGDSFGLELPRELLPPTLKRLRMFVLRSRLQLDDASDEWPALAVAGRDAEDGLRRLQLPVPATALAVASQAGVQVQRRPGRWPHFRLRAAPERLAALESALSPWPVLETGQLRLAELLAGVPVVRGGSVEEFVPQTADLDLAGGISFSKGCYPGQEIVARVHYLGRLKQRLHLAVCAQPGLPGQPVVRVGAESGTAGTVMDSAPLPGGDHLLGLVLPIEQPAGVEWRLGDADGPSLRQLHPARH
ncbi:MAG: folate-binding protein [Nevskiaceae bacterium]|nr:MAG: folate-binding protein [Nevskiaceae bacterium]TAM23235.1 MAG: folate-binding protein [Nevskiaceae bacterium]